MSAFWEFSHENWWIFDMQIKTKEKGLLWSRWCEKHFRWSLQLFHSPKLGMKQGSQTPREPDTQRDLTKFKMFQNPLFDIYIFLKFQNVPEAYFFFLKIFILITTWKYSHIVEYFLYIHWRSRNRQINMLQHGQLWAFNSRFRSPGFWKCLEASVLAREVKVEDGKGNLSSALKDSDEHRSI